MKFAYNEKVLEHFLHPHNVGSIENADGKAMEGSPACGDMIALYIKVDHDTQIITDIKFESYGCASNIATASIITDLAMNKSIDEAKTITWKQASEALGGLPPIKVHCSVLAVDSLHAAIQNYEELNGLVTELEDTTTEIVTKRLSKVMNPVIGFDIVHTGLVKEVLINEGEVTVSLELKPDDRFASAIKEDILEKIECLWDIKNVTVIFTL